MNNAVVVVELFDPIIEIAREIVNRAGYPSGSIISKLKKRLQDYDKALARWRESHRKAEEGEEDEV